MRDAKICLWLHSKLGANYVVRGVIISVVCLAERQVTQQSAHALMPPISKRILLVMK